MVHKLENWRAKVLEMGKRLWGGRYVTFRLLQGMYPSTEEKAGRVPRIQGQPGRLGMYVVESINLKSFPA